MKKLVVRTTLNSSIDKVPSSEDIRAGITSALIKLCGPIGAAGFAWGISNETVRFLDDLTLEFELVVESPCDNKSMVVFASAMPLVKGFGFEKVSLVVLSIE